MTDKRRFYETDTKFFYQNIIAQRSKCLYRWQRHVSQQRTENALLCFHWNNSYANVPECYTRTLAILF
jgi:hypothetical protein